MVLEVGSVPECTGQCLCQEQQRPQGQTQWQQQDWPKHIVTRARVEGQRLAAEEGVRLGLLDLGHYVSLELGCLVLNPRGITGSQSIHTRPVGCPAGITPAHNACQVPDTLHRAGEWAPRVTLRRKAIQQLGPNSGLWSAPSSLHSKLCAQLSWLLYLPGRHPCHLSRSQHTPCPAGWCEAPRDWSRCCTGSYTSHD